MQWLNSYNYKKPYLFLRSDPSPPPLEIRRSFWRCQSRLNWGRISPVPQRSRCVSRGCRGDPGSGSVCSACTEAEATAAGQCPAQHPWIRGSSERVAAPVWGCPLPKTELRLQDSEASLRGRLVWVLEERFFVSPCQIQSNISWLRSYKCPQVNCSKFSLTYRL